ncbi:MAG: DUF885 domain-containing protein [Proteobacteria bacterium]|nr:DUF885 domain-containing protein [Pseudomonadota bacterium]
MHRRIVLLMLCLSCPLAAAAQPPAAQDWVETSNRYTSRLLQVHFAHDPEDGSQQGLAEYDPRITVPTLADELAERHELESTLAAVLREGAKESDQRVQEDLEILRKAFDQQFRRQDYALAHEVPYVDASRQVFQGVRALLDDQVSAERRPAAVQRLRKYAGMDGGRPFTEILKERALAQMDKPGVLYPAREEVQTDLGRNPNYVDGLAQLFARYQVQGWEDPCERIRTQLTAYDTWVRQAVLPRARTDFRLPPQKYALAFEKYGIDVPPAKIAAMAHEAFGQYQAQMAPLAASIARQRGMASSDYRDVIRELKKQQITGDAILPFFRARLGQIEALIREQQLVTLPARPAIIRLATAAETAAQPAPHMQPPPFLHNTGQRGEFVLPLNIPSATGGAADKYDDFTFDAVAWTLTAHEARPGHELQFDSMLEQGVSLARALYAFNSTNAEGWGLYSEYIMQPYEPAEGQLLTLQLRLLRAARAIIDPELQSGQMNVQQAYAMLENDVVLSHAFATEEVERFTFRAPGQANSYFYGYTRLLELRKEVEEKLGARFSAQKFHDFILAQGLLPPDLMRKAVLEDFVPAQQK